MSQEESCLSLEMTLDGVLLGQCEVEAQASRGLVAYMDGAPVQQHRILHDCQTQSGASHFTASPFVDTVKAFKKS